MAIVKKFLLQLFFRDKSRLTGWISFCLLCFGTLFGGSVDTVRIASSDMDTTLKAVVVVPDGYSDTQTTWPVVYVLHGYSGNYSNWSRKMDLRPVSDQYGCILVCPDGGKNSWYLDSPVDNDSRYESYLISDVIPWVDRMYRTIDDREGRAITGLSMGGQGALYLALRHPDMFIATGSMSGGIDLTVSTKRWEIADKLGSYKQYPTRWEENSVMNMAELFQGSGLHILIDCGVNDIFIDANRTLHQRLLKNKVAHTYIERTGGHTWSYWINALEYHCLFFQKVMNHAN